MNTNKNQTISIICVDDEENSLAALELLIKRYFPQLKIIATALNVVEAVKLIEKHKPQIVLLDISLPDGSGFDVLERTTFKGYEVIFTTSFNQYAVQAFEFSALHYLIKPINRIKLTSAIERYRHFNTFEGLDHKLSIMRDSIYDTPKKILLPTSDGVHIFNISDIIRCEASANYTNVYFSNGNVLLVSKNLQHFDQIFSNYHFSRVHNSHLINLNYLKKYTKGKYATAIMKDKSEIPISEKNKKDFLKKLKLFADKL